MIRWSCTGRDIGVQKSRQVNKYKQYGDEVGKIGWAIYRLTMYSCSDRLAAQIADEI